MELKVKIWTEVIAEKEWKRTYDWSGNIRIVSAQYLPGPDAWFVCFEQREVIGVYDY